MTRAAAALIGADATLVGVLVSDPDTLLVARFTAGGTQGCILMASFSVALD